MEGRKKKYLFFDLDGTLTRGDTFTGFIRHVFGTAGLLRVLAVSAPAILLWKAGFKDNTYAKLRMFSAAFRGMRAEEFRSRGASFASVIDRMARPESMQRLRKAAADRETVAIVSASLGDWIRPWAQRNGVGIVISTEAETDPHGRLTGRFSTPNCQRGEKSRRILETFPDLGGKRDRCFVEAWGDSAGDIEMFALADKTVNPKSGETHSRPSCPSR